MPSPGRFVQLIIRPDKSGSLPLNRTRQRGNDTSISGSPRLCLKAAAQELLPTPLFEKNQSIFNQPLIMQPDRRDMV
jgi:hypothetical protein